jgi:hypothetical protein
VTGLLRYGEKGLLRTAPERRATDILTSRSEEDILMCRDLVTSVLADEGVNTSTAVLMRSVFAVYHLRLQNKPHGIFTG